MGINDSVTELEDSLKGFDKLLVQSNKDALKLKASLSGMDKIVSGDNYQIISRFLSGTGAWKVLNKAKATVMTMIQLVSVQERAALQDNLRMKEMANLIKDRRELLKLESHFKKAALNQDKELIETLKEKSDVFASQAMIVGDDKALKEMLRRIKKSKGLLNKILGKGKISGKTIVEDPMSKNILDSNLLQTAAIAGGFYLNQKFLKQMAQSSGFIERYMDEQNDKLEILGKQFDSENESPTQTQEGMQAYMDKKFAFVSEQIGFKVTKASEKSSPNTGGVEWGNPKLDMTDAEEMFTQSSKIFKNITLDPRKWVSHGMDYVKNLKDVSGETHENNWKAIDERKKLFKLEKKLKEVGAEKKIVALQQQIAINKAAGHDSPRLEAELAPLQEHMTYLNNMFDEQRNLIQTSGKDKQDKRVKRLSSALGFKTDEEKEKYAETLMKRRKLFKRIWQKPVLKIRESIEENGGVFAAIGDFLDEGLVKLVEFTSKMVGYLKKAFIYLGLMLLALFVLYRVFKSAGVREALAKIWEDTKNFYTNYLVPPLMMIWDGLSQIIKGFQEGKFYLVLLGLLQIFGGLIIFSLQLMSLTFQVGLRLLKESLIGIYNWLFKSGDNMRKTASKIGYIASAIIFLVAFFMGGWVLALAGAIVLGLSMLLEHLSFFAGGGTTTGGLSVVGEKGPELVKLPVGSRVHSNVDSRKMLAGGNTTNNITVQVTGRVGASDSEIKDIADKLSRELNNRMNRTGSAVSGF